MLALSGSWVFFLFLFVSFFLLFRLKMGLLMILNVNRLNTYTLREMRALPPLALVMGRVPRGWWEKALCCRQAEKGNG